MQFNTAKCKVMHIGRLNCAYEYHMNGCVLHTVDYERDLGVIIRNDLTVSDQCAKAYAKASKMLGLIGRNIRFKNAEIMLQLYKTLVRPLVEYCTVAWSPHYQKDEQLLEKIQHRFIRTIPEFKKQTYEKGMHLLQLQSLEQHRNRTDLIFLYKMYHGHTRPRFEEFFQLACFDKTRGHHLKLQKHCSSRDVRLHFFPMGTEQLEQPACRSSCC
jgi:ribonucleases P/MRP protein subunit RPP40